MNIPFTLVSTVLNEKERIEESIAEIEKQLLHPNEIIITDAGSKDGTYERLLRWKAESTIPIIILQKIKCGAAEGRNMAIKAAKYDLIASTDFGCRYTSTWLQELVAPFQDPSIKVVGGAYDIFEKDMNSPAEKAAYIMYNGYKIDVHHPRFIPSSRSIAYYKSVWEHVGGYNEWLTLTGDDYLFGNLILKKGYKIYPSEKCNVYWGRHANAIGYAKEAFRYGIGEGETQVNIRNVFSSTAETLIRYAFCIALMALLIAKFIFAAPIPGYYFLFLLPMLIGFRSYFKYFKSWLQVRSSKYNFKTLLLGFYIIELMRIYHFKGWVKGYRRAKLETSEAYRNLRNDIKSFQFK